MAVPKKRRVTRKLLNRAFKANSFYSSAYAAATTQVRLSGLGKSLEASTLGTFNHKSFIFIRKPPLRLPAAAFDYPTFKLPPALFKEKKPLNVMPLSTTVLIQVSPLVGEAVYTLRVYPNYLFTYPWKAHVYHKFFFRQHMFAMKAPYAWGAQRGLLLRTPKFYPSYMFLLPASMRVTSLHYFSKSPIYLLWSSNLKRPFGPTLRELWAYTKSNPNEGYWIYRMWLNVKKRWRRWIVFSYKYVWRYNIFQRTSILQHFDTNMTWHRYSYIYDRFGCSYYKLWLTLTSKFRLPTHLERDSLSTVLAKKLTQFNFLKKG